MKTKRSFASLAAMAMAVGALSCSAISTAHACPPTGTCSSACQSAAAAAPEPASDLVQLERKHYGATVLLYAQTAEGGYRMMCTATAFEKVGRRYHFATAAHCVSEDNTDHDRVDVAKTSWFITFDEPGNKNMIEAKIVGVGYQHRGDDFAVLEAELTKDCPTMPLAGNDPTFGEEVVNIASPHALGKQLFLGHVSRETLDRPIVEESINWRGATLLQISGGPGSSGSSAVSQQQGGIIAFIVGTIGGHGSPNIVSIPVSRFKKFWSEVKAGTYRWYKPDDGSLSASSDKERGRVERLWHRIHVTGINYRFETETERQQ
jgi:hypothetical protein